MEADRTRHTCHCGKSFIRREHLRRHEATHGERQHVCSICQRSFTRNDLLKRHISVHTASDQASLRQTLACDACYENKTRCDGGESCSLCTKRGITCTVSRVRTSKQKKGPAQEANGDPGENASDDDDIHMDQDPRIHDYQDVLNNGRNPVISEDARQSGSGGLAHAGMRCILEALQAFSTDKVIPKLSCPDHVKQWVSSCTKAYFGPFHDRWPLVHAPLFDTTHDDILIVATVVMIGSILRDRDPTVRELTVQVHSYLHSHCMKSLMAPKEENLDECIWPYETYQLALLNVIAALELGVDRPVLRLLQHFSLMLSIQKPVAIRNANRLLSFIIISMRENNVFDSKFVERHQNKHFPGTFGPWVLMGRDRWRWQAAVVLQLDAYLSLFTFQPPFLRLKELGLGLLATYTLRNSHGLIIFFKRLPDEPEDRQRTKISNVAQSSQALPASGLLIEDIQIGLSGLLTKIWSWRKDVQSSFHLSPVEVQNRDQIEAELTEWESQICQLFESFQAPDVNPQTVNFLFRAYTGEEEPGQDGWQGPVMARISNLLFDICMFYYCLNLHLFADVQSILNIGALPTKDDEDRAMLSQWASSGSARQAAYFAIRALQTCERTFPQGLQAGGAFTPMAKLCLATACVVFHAWAVSAPQTCTCRVDPRPTIPDVNLNDREARQEWIRVGGSIYVEGTLLCSCVSDLWVVRFTTALACDLRIWEFGVQRIRNIFAEETMELQT